MQFLDFTALDVSAGLQQLMVGRSPNIVAPAPTPLQPRPATIGSDDLMLPLQVINRYPICYPRLVD